jgi:zinc transporter ZupT
MPSLPHRRQKWCVKRGFSMVVALALSVVAGAATTVGIYAARFKRPWVDAGRAEFAGFAGGVLVALCVLRLMPESVHTSRYAPLGAFAGYSLLLLVSRAVAGVEAGSEAKRRTLVPLLGIGLHSLLDGVTLSVACRADPIVGVMVAIGLILHELPEGILTYGLLRYAGIAAR